MPPRPAARPLAAAPTPRRVACGFALLVAATAGAAVPPEFAPAVAAAERGDAAECARLFTTIAQEATQRGLARRAHYGAAVCAATAGELDSAFGALAAALALDFHDAQRFYVDPRLRPLRVDARWPALEAAFHGAVERWRAGLNAELEAIYRADQADRSAGPGGIDWTEVTPRDEERERRVRAIVASGVDLSADDRYHAAMVLQHGEDREDYELAHELALRAARDDADHPHARWLAAATLDRALIAAGAPQRYGTQSIVENGRWVLAPVDPAVDDAERARWDVPPLAESRARAEAMNGGGAPAAATPPSESPSASLPASLPESPPAAPPAGR